MVIITYIIYNNNNNNNNNNKHLYSIRKREAGTSVRLKIRAPLNRLNTVIIN